MSGISSSISSSTSATPRAPKSLVGPHSVAGYTPADLATSFIYINTQVANVLTGALTANTLSTMLSVSGAGSLQFLAIINNVDTTARTMRTKITVDGTVVYDFTSASTTSSTAFACFIGEIIALPTVGCTALATGTLSWNTSLLVEFASSLTETGKNRLLYEYRTE